MDRLLPRRATQRYVPVRFAGYILQAVYRALERTRQRRALNGLSDAMLRDIGLTRRDVARETAKPFWQR
jgi:uncharacterized protein YjiS (DUF1127 family)